MNTSPLYRLIDHGWKTEFENPLAQRFEMHPCRISQATVYVYCLHSVISIYNSPHG